MKIDKTAGLRLALQAVLLFHEGGPWDEGRRRSWALLTGGQEATTRVLCNIARAALVEEKPK